MSSQGALRWIVFKTGSCFLFDHHEYNLTYSIKVQSGILGNPTPVSSAPLQQPSTGLYAPCCRLAGMARSEPLCLFPIYRAWTVYKHTILGCLDTQNGRLAGHEAIFAEFDKKVYGTRIADYTFNALFNSLSLSLSLSLSRSLSLCLCLSFLLCRMCQVRPTPRRRAGA